MENREYILEFDHIYKRLKPLKPGDPSLISHEKKKNDRN